MEHLSTVKEEIDHEQVTNETLAIVKVSSPECIQARLPGSFVLHRNKNCSSKQPGSQIAQSTIPSQAKTLMPVNIKQIEDAWCTGKLNNLVINNTIVASVKLVGQIYNKKTDEYKGTFRFVDCTGAINASIWFTYGRAELDAVSEGAYAMVVGRVKVQGIWPEIDCFACKTVTNFNDITHHHLSVIATHIDLVLKPERKVHDLVAEMWAADIAKSDDFGKNKPSNMMLPIKKRAKVNEMINAPAEQTRNETIKERIMHIIRSQKDRCGQEGVHVEFICENISIEKEVIKSLLEVLVDDGEIYTTIDMNHYAPS